MSGHHISSEEEDKESYDEDDMEFPEPEESKAALELKEVSNGGAKQ